MNSEPPTLRAEPCILNPERLACGLYWNRAWSLVDGCSPCGYECDHCWAAAGAHLRARNPVPAIARRYKGLTDRRGRFNGALRIHEELLPQPLRAKKPTVWSVWNDLLHDSVPNGLISAVMDVIADARCEQQRFLICTKRPQRWQRWLQWHEEHWSGDGPYNLAAEVLDGCSPAVGLPLMLGTTVGHQAAMRRAEELADSPMSRAAPLFLSIEPLLGPLEFRPGLLSQFAWAIVGCESGPRRRPCELAWVESAVDQLRAAGVRVFVKQLDLAAGGKRGVFRTIEEFPRDLQLRELPRSFYPKPAPRA